MSNRDKPPLASNSRLLKAILSANRITMKFLRLSVALLSFCILTGDAFPKNDSLITSASTDEIAPSISGEDSNEASSRNLPILPLRAPSPPFKTVSSSSQTIQLPIEWEKRDLVSGNKRLVMTADGAIKYLANGREIGQFSLPFSLDNTETGKSQWIAPELNFPDDFFERNATNVFFTEDGSLTCSKVIKVEESRAELSTSLRLREDGLVALTYQWSEWPTSDYRLRPRTSIFGIPLFSARDTSFILDDKSYTVPNSGFGTLANKKGFSLLTVFPDDPARTLSVHGTEWTKRIQVQTRKNEKLLWFRFSQPQNARKIEFLLDIRVGTSAPSDTPTFAGINFKTTDDLEMPDLRLSRNLILNPSFEQGIHGYDLADETTEPQPWGADVFEIDSNVSHSGKQSMKLAAPISNGRDYRKLGWQMRHQTVPLPAGEYTFSLFAKSEGSARFAIWFPNASWVGNRKKSLPIGWKNWDEEGARMIFDLSPEWKRYELTFTVPESMPVYAAFGADSPDGESQVWVDDLQLESGSKTTGFTTRPIAGNLRTSLPSNFLSPADPLNARLELTAAPQITGKAEVQIINFFDEILFEKEYPFTTDEDGKAIIELSVETNLPRGVFVIKAIYHLDDGTKTTEFHRLTIMDFLENQHRLKAMFSENYGDTDIERFDFLNRLDRYRKIGIGGKNHTYTWDKDAWEAYSEYGIESTDSVMLAVIAPYTGVHKKVEGFALMRERGINGLRPEDPRILIRDFNFDSEGEPSEEWLHKFRDTVAMLAQENPWIPMWAFGIEVYSKFPIEWWSQDGDPKHAYRNFAIILKAFYQGVKQGNPDALVYQGSPSNMAPERGIAETGHMLSEVNKIGGVKFDWIGIHNYRKRPESPDLDADTQTLLTMLEKHGYEDTPVFWPEGMHWGPYTIPQWGIESASWRPPHAWYYGALSYDMGWTEKISAAWRARSWLVALKYQDRVKSSQSSGFRNNFAMDIQMTPFATQKISNTLGRLLGDAEFREDIRFASYMRCYVFQDSEGRPVAALWCHHPKLDAGTMEAPIVSAQFSSENVEIFDLMEAQREFAPDSQGNLVFPVSSFPLFFRGQSGSLQEMLETFRNARLVSGEGVAPIIATGRPSSPTQANISIRNLVSREFSGQLKLEDSFIDFQVQGAGKTDFLLALPLPLSDQEIVVESLPTSIHSKELNLALDLSFRGLLSSPHDSAITIDGDLNDWTGVPKIPFTGRRTRDLEKVSDDDFSASFMTSWTERGFYLAVEVSDDHFVVRQQSNPEDRWQNDTLQVYFDSLADARSNQHRGYDENDYDFTIHPSEDGTSAEVYRRRSPDPQLGLAVDAPPDNALAPEIPVAFRKSASGYTYEIYFPAKYLLPLRLENGSSFGFSLTLNDRDVLDEPIESSLTVLRDGQDSYNRPHLWPVLLLWNKD